MKQQAERDYLHNQVEELKKQNEQLKSRLEQADGENKIADFNQTIVTAAGSDRSQE